VVFDDGKTIEVQIRTPEMDQSAEYGIAAHWRYKEGFSRDEDYERRILWLRSLMEWRQDVEDAKEFVEGMKSDVFEDRVYVFTPAATSSIFQQDLHQSISLIMYIQMLGTVARSES